MLFAGLSQTGLRVLLIRIVIVVMMMVVMMVVAVVGVVFLNHFLGENL